MILDRLRTAIVAGIKAGLPALRDCRPHPGRFTLPELKATAAQAPAVRVAVLGATDVMPTQGGVAAMVQCAAFVVTADRPQLPRDVGALLLVSGLLPLVPLNCWGLDDQVDGAAQVRADNMFARDVAEQGVAMWAVSWRHEVVFATADLSALDDFLRLYGTVEIDPDAPAPALHVDLPGPDPEPEP